MDKIEKLWTLDPERREHVIKILLHHAMKLQMGPETEMLTKWLEEGPESGSGNENQLTVVPNSLRV